VWNTTAASATGSRAEGPAAKFWNSFHAIFPKVNSACKNVVVRLLPPRTHRIPRLINAHEMERKVGQGLSMSRKPGGAEKDVVLLIVLNLLIERVNPAGSLCLSS
jgi:hypothetical protein